VANEAEGLQQDSNNYDPTTRRRSLAPAVSPHAHHMPLPFSLTHDVQIQTAISPEHYLEVLNRELEREGASALRIHNNRLTFRGHRMLWFNYPEISAISSAEFAVNASQSGLNISFTLRYTTLIIAMLVFTLVFTLLSFGYPANTWQWQFRVMWILFPSLIYAINVVLSYLYVRRTLRSISVKRAG
jgi:hypothetical protein